MTAPALLTVDLQALAANYRTLEAAGGVPVHPVVKADAYGLGADACAGRLMQEGARTFFVARTREGERLRAALGPTPAIYVLDGCLTGRASRLREADLRPVLNTEAQVTEWRAAGGGRCGLQIDTGMNRLGFRPEAAPEPFEGLDMVLSHLACADDPAEPMNARQRDAFAVAAARYPGTVRSFANSGGIFLGEDYGFDASRPGICLYGGGPEGRPDERIRPVATLTAEVLQVRDVPAGESVGYSRGFIAESPRRIATVAAGYADGVLRSYSPRGEVFVGGALRPILGRISMDVCAVDVTGLEVAVGDRVEMFGGQRMLDDAAAAAGTVAWELLTSVSARVPRTWVG
ncbi:MAG: alanine racemase [Brevundimonas sp.]|uniref:alanine racemase n=1 Tax=Brevundimonas sp. TaxID=1871086 RepID=UPI0026398275|nr:alanine racemase [Brevundimonas sp.]MDI6623979.1 alanine racemase [Brevundimonas sp.]MDQ7811958.1 alanine racemase [Brevundimonas sp.]